jgi:hypothetical protein
VEGLVAFEGERGESVRGKVGEWRYAVIVVVFSVTVMRGVEMDLLGEDSRTCA